MKKTFSSSRKETPNNRNVMTPGLNAEPTPKRHDLARASSAAAIDQSSIETNFAMTKHNVNLQSTKTK